MPGTILCAGDIQGTERHKAYNQVDKSRDHRKNKPRDRKFMLISAREKNHYNIIMCFDEGVREPFQGMTFDLRRKS